MLNHNIKKSLNSCNNTNTITDNVYKPLLDVAFNTIKNNTGPADLSSLYGSKPDVIKSVFAALLTAISEFVRHDFTKSQVHKYLTEECKFQQNRANIFSDLYEANKVYTEISLSNIGSHLDHIVDIKWSIDYIMAASNISEPEGPIFRVSLITENFDPEVVGAVQKEVRFSCNSQELQDLVYKLKEASIHCQKFADRKSVV